MKSNKFLLLLAGVVLTLSGCGESNVSIQESSSVIPSSSEVLSSSEVSSSEVSSSEMPSSEASSSEAPSSESSSESSSEDPGLVAVQTKFTPGTFASMKDNVSAGAVMFNSVFGVTAGTTLDTGGGKTVTVDGTSVASGGRLKLNGAGSKDSKAIKIVATSAGKLRFFCCSANSKDTSRKYTVSDESGAELVTSAEGVTTSISQYEYDVPAAGTYYLYSKVNGINYYYLDFTQRLALGTLTGFEINANAVNKDYLLGEAFSPSGLIVNEVYSSGARLEVDSGNYTLDASAYNSSVASTYSIKVKYKNYDDKTFDVKVHDVSKIETISDPVNKSSSGDKNVYRTVSAYKLNGTAVTDSLVTKAVSSDGYSKKVTATAADMDLTTEGNKEVTYSYVNSSVTYTDTLEYAVVDASKLTKDISDNYVVDVDPDVAIDGSVADGILTFKNIQEAHDFLKQATGDADKKVISIKDGTYNEKLYIEIPNLTLRSASGDASKVVIQCDYDADTSDSNGITWSTYGSSSVTVQPTATGFAADKITFNNSKFTTMAEYLADHGNLQACAIVSRADGCLYADCVFNGFQDTLYINDGTAEFTDCRISGMTDFIFGEASDAYFKNCAIVCKNKGSTTNNGYIVAQKPSSSPSIGFVFDACDISGEEGMADGTVSLARSWGKLAKVSYVNCSIGACISKAAYPASAGNSRWEAMSGNFPTESTYQEYNNTGDGSIDTAVTGGSILTEDQYNALVGLIAATFNY